MQKKEEYIQIDTKLNNKVFSEALALSQELLLLIDSINQNLKYNNS